MKKPSIYVDTSVIGGCLDPEFQEWSNGLLLDFKAGNFSLSLSILTNAEIQDAPGEVMEIYAEFRKYADKSDTPRRAGGLMSGADSKAVDHITEPPR